VRRLNTLINRELTESEKEQRRKLQERLKGRPAPSREVFEEIGIPVFFDEEGNCI
jgi:hypothetical protein